MKTKIIAIALTLAALGTVEASAGAIYGPNGAIVGYNHTGMNTVGGAWAGSLGTSWKYDCRYNYYVLAY
jgi:hypothetical protein